MSVWPAAATEAHDDHTAHEPGRHRSTRAAHEALAGGTASLALAGGHSEESRSRHLAELLLKAQEQERRRIAQELHDEPLQLLVHLGRRLESLETERGVPAAIAAELRAAREQTTTIANRLRMLVGGLRPPALEHFGLVAALRGFLVATEDETGIRTDFQVGGDETRLPPEVELGAFRITQEAVNNVIRHAHAKSLRVWLEFRKDAFALRVSDDGEGFDPALLDQAPESARLGLLGMRERAEILGGRVQIRTGPTVGTTVEARIPLR